MVIKVQDVIKKIHDYSLEDIMGKCFGRYCKYIIQDRAIPDVRDGLKPVQRRIIFAMYKDKNTYDKKFKKCANAVGNVLGKYHPHGDTSVYDALIRMSQDWKQSHTLVEVSGNNGSIDGDPPAAYRYTESRLAKISEELLRDIDKNTVEMAPNYDDTLLEPTVLPVRFPNLLVNGSTGISAGYATNIPPHNLGEVIDATIKRIDSPNCRLETILEIVKGPDFPTGGTVEGIDGIRQAYETGKAKVVLKSKYEFVKTKGKEQIIITEIPFEVNKSLLVKKIDDIRIDKKIDGIVEVRDESDKESNLRIAIDLKSGANKELVLNYLLKNTELQINYNYNMVAIVNRRPKLMGILPMLDAFIAHKKEVVKRRSEFELAAYKREMHLTEGLVKAISILDDVIRVIRASKDKNDATNNLIKEFGFTFEQADAIVKLQLYRLTNFDVLVLQERLKDLLTMIEILEKILNDEEALNSELKKELREVKKAYAIPRKTQIKEEVTEIKINEQDLITKENVVIVLTKDGYLKKVSLKSYSSSNAEDTTLKPGDYVISLYETNTLNKLLIFTSKGNYLYIPIHEIPWCRWKELGKHVNNLVVLHPDDNVVASYVVNESINNGEVVIFSKNGNVKRTKINDFIVSRYSKSYTAMKLKDDDEIVSVEMAQEKTLIITETGYYLSYATTEIPLVGAKASGVKGINLKDDVVVSGLSYKMNDEYVNIFTNRNTAKRVKLSELNNLSRAKRGSTLIKKVKSTPYLVRKAFITNSRDSFVLLESDKFEVLKNSEISIMDDSSTGSIISKDLVDVFLKLDLKEIKDEEIELPKMKPVEEVKELTIDDFLNDFKI